MEPQKPGNFQGSGPEVVERQRVARMLVGITLPLFSIFTVLLQKNTLLSLLAPNATNSFSPFRLVQRQLKLGGLLKCKKR